MNKSRNHILDHVNNLLDKGVRFDRRAFDEFREISVERGITPNAEGSARVKIGDTEVLAGVKMSVEKPYPDSPEKGNISVNVELLPLSSPRFEPGPPSIEAVEIARVVDRGIRESGAIDVKQLCIEPAEKVWTAFIDICTINDAGNLQDAASLAALVALKDTRLPEIVDGAVNYKKKTDAGLPLSVDPIEVTVVKIGKNLIVDPTSEEEKVLDGRLTAAITDDNSICALQKGGDETLSLEEIDKMLTIATEKSQEIRKFL